MASRMSALLRGIQTLLKDPASGLGIKEAVITRAEQPPTCYPFAQIFPFAVSNRDGDSESRVGVYLYQDYAAEEAAVTGLYDLAAEVAALLRKAAERLAEGVDLAVSDDHDIGERVEADGEGKVLSAASWIGITIRPIWLEDSL